MQCSGYTEQVDILALDPDRQGFETLAGTGAVNTLTGINQKARVMHRTLYQRTLDIEKLMIDPVEWRSGMRAAVAISKKLTIASNYEAFYSLTG